MRIERPSCTLRLWQVQDVIALPGLASDPEVSRYLLPRFPHPYTESDARSWVALNLGAAPVLNLAIEVGGRLAGGIGLVPGHEERAGSLCLGYWLGRNFWGRGVMSDAAAAMADYGVETFAPRRFWSYVMEPNVASTRVLEKIGFVREATLRGAIVDRYGKVHDELVFTRRLDGSN